MSCGQDDPEADAAADDGAAEDATALDGTATDAGAPDLGPAGEAVQLEEPAPVAGGAAPAPAKGVSHAGPQVQQRG